MRADTVAPPPDAEPPRALRLPPGISAASAGFGRVVPDAQVVALMRRYGVRPYGVRFLVHDHAMVHEVPPESASVDLIAAARRALAEQARPGVCAFLGRANESDGRDAAPAPGERDPRSRMLLSSIEMARDVPRRLLGGDPAVYGVTVLGDAAALRRLAADPLVREFNTAFGPPGRQVVPGPAPPESSPMLPWVDSLSTGEVQRRLARYTAEGLPECRGWQRNADLTEATVRVSPSAEVDGVRFGVRTETSNAREGGTIGSTRVRAVITLENRTGRPLDVPVLGCTESLRLYTDPERRRRALPNEGVGAQCMQDPYVIALAAGERREIETELDAARVLGDSLPPGRYHLSALFRLRDRTLEIPAGEVTLESGRQTLAYRARVRLEGGEVVGRGVVINTGRTAVALEFGSCALALRARRTAAGGAPAWRSEGRQPYEGGMFYGCDLVGRSAVLQPGDSLDRFEIRVPVLEVLGDSLPDGRYRFTAVIELNSGRSPEIPAGTLSLSAHRRPLGPERLSGVMTFRASTTVSRRPTPTIVTTVVGTLTHAGGSAETFSAGCPVELQAYRSRADRDAAPRAGPPDWTSHPRCGPARQEYSLNRGETRTWTVRATARDILGRSLPAGRYYFAAVVHHEGTRVFLDAGQADLSR